MSFCEKKPFFTDSNKVVVYPLHSSLSTAEQTSVFNVPEEGVRKIVVSTNIAETSITIEDVVFVVDAGRVKENRQDEVAQMQTLGEILNVYIYRFKFVNPLLLTRIPQSSLFFVLYQLSAG